MLTYLSNALSFVNLDYRCTNLPSYYIEPSMLHRFLDRYAHTYKIIILIWLLYMVLDQYAPTWQVIVLNWAFYNLVD
jgi:hypothetical protein